jgi:hypothetical protein
MSPAKHIQKFVDKSIRALCAKMKGKSGLTKNTKGNQAKEENQIHGLAASESLFPPSCNPAEELSANYANGYDFGCQTTVAAVDERPRTGF